MTPESVPHTLRRETTQRRLEGGRAKEGSKWEITEGYRVEWMLLALFPLLNIGDTLSWEGKNDP